MASTVKNLDLVRKHRLTVRDYHRMGEAGIFHEDSHVELIDGEIIDMPAIGSPHAGTVKRLVHLFNLAIGQMAVLSVQDPVILDEHSEPEPDIALLRPRADFYTDSHPRPEDILLIVEVAESSLRYDREIKLALYARFAIPEVWLVDVEHKKLSLFSEPVQGAYREVINPASLGPIAPRQLPKLSVDVTSLFSNDSRLNAEGG